MSLYSQTRKKKKDGNFAPFSERERKREIRGGMVIW
jgi:hypothetical protein